ncbi:MAG: DNA polymerase IV, partial [Clostridia bacterium]|nr:DNA polymerase IV [Clostridia bacterium]
VTVIGRDDYRRKVWPLAASALLYVGRSTGRELGRFGIRTIGDLACARPEFLSQRLGKCGETLWAFANGYDLSPVSAAGAMRTIKSIGNSMTTPRDIENEEEAWRVITALSESVAQRLRENGLRCVTVQLSLRDTELVWREHQAKLATPCCTTDELAAKSMELLRESYDFRRPLRSLGVRACSLSDASSGVQLAFFDDTVKRERHEALERSVDGIRKKYGRLAVQRAVLLHDDLTHEGAPAIHLCSPTA